ncbi:uncharacterized protein [Cherax quadricarinatus]|uniref:uncharacterized protein isoform X2 n=1 Tax=Cherax quadricarinatus TaxID=27406 RepID=UPI0023796C43|nr:uncharacterized protein LOC128701229 isoform X2 [Cherax quadricarinatus]
MTFGVGVTDGWWQRPEFGPAESIVTVQEGETAKLPCVVLHLNDKSVTWLRRRDLHILTAGHHTYSADQRFQVVHAEGSDEWTLVVRYSQLRDAGVYECQINTEPKLSRHVKLRVHDPRQVVTKAKVFVANNTASTKDGNLRVEILGPRELYIEEGSSLSLTCLVTSLRGPSALVYWYHDTSLIDYNSPRGGVNLKIDRGRGETTTRLVVSSVGPGDSGMYSCVPQGSHPATVLVHVQKGKHEAAIQQGGLNAAAPPFFFSSSALLSSCLFLHLCLLPLIFTSELGTLSCLRFSAFSLPFIFLALILIFHSSVKTILTIFFLVLLSAFHGHMFFSFLFLSRLELVHTRNSLRPPSAVYDSSSLPPSTIYDSSSLPLPTVSDSSLLLPSSAVYDSSSSVPPTTPVTSSPSPQNNPSLLTSLFNTSLKFPSTSITSTLHAPAAASVPWWHLHAEWKRRSHGSTL